MVTPRPRPLPTDGHRTETSDLQSATEETLLMHIPDGSQSPCSLHRNLHLTFLLRNLIQGFPSRYTSQDASQPWLMFWTLQSFSILQVGIDPGNKQKAIDTILAWQHPDGGFGGGSGQSPHLLPTYAAVCALAIVGRPGPNGGWDQINRGKLYEFFMSLKQPDGSFLVTHHAEVDVRGIYCLLVTAHLLNLLTPELVAGTASFIASCQTYEGGFSSSSQPYYQDASPNDPALLREPRPPLGEAHGGYTFCALASWVMLQPFLRAMSVEELKPTINLGRLLRWASHMQGTEIELGGFKGRTNKLVDGCYSWWVGGIFALLEALGVGGSRGQGSELDGADGERGEWHDADDMLLNRVALQEYILYAGQYPTGGLRDKPPKSADAYHTLYCLAGLSAAQHHICPSPARRSELLQCWTSSETSVLDELHRSAFTETLSWQEEDGASIIVGDASNRLNATHPLFNLTITHCEAIMAHFYGQAIPTRQHRKAT